MATQKKEQQPTYQPDREYRVRLKKPVKIAGITIRPSAEEIIVKGKVLPEIEDAILEVKAV